MKMEASSLNPQNNHGIMDEEDDPRDSMSSPLQSDDSSNSATSSISDLTEDAISSLSSSSSSDRLTASGLFEMSSLMEHLPFKRGLSKYFQGKSQSFTCLSNVRCLEELAKPDKPYKKKKLKSCKSYGGHLDSHRSHTPKTTSSSRTISKKSSRNSSLFSNRNGSFLGHSHRPPIPPRIRIITSLSTPTESNPIHASERAEDLSFE